MGKLDGAVFYLSGSIEYASDAGIGWRQQIKELIQNSGLKIRLIDPTRKPGETECQIAENKGYQERLQKEGKFEELRKYVHDYRRKDLRYVDISDAMIVLIDHTTYQCGTLNELFLAEMQHKPIFTICKGGLYQLPRWLFDCVDFNLLSEDVEGVVNKLVEIDSSEKPLDDKWVLVRKYI